MAASGGIRNLIILRSLGHFGKSLPVTVMVT